MNLPTLYIDQNYIRIVDGGFNNEKDEIVYNKLLNWNLQVTCETEPKVDLYHVSTTPVSNVWILYPQNQVVATLFDKHETTEKILSGEILFAQFQLPPRMKGIIAEYDFKKFEYINDVFGLLYRYNKREMRNFRENNRPNPLYVSLDDGKLNMCLYEMESECTARLLNNIFYDYDYELVFDLEFKEIPANLDVCILECSNGTDTIFMLTRRCGNYFMETNNDTCPLIITENDDIDTHQWKINFNISKNGYINVIEKSELCRIERNLTDYSERTCYIKAGIHMLEKHSPDLIHMRINNLKLTIL